MKEIEKIITSMNMMLKNTEVIGLIPLPESKKYGRWTFGYTTNDYTLYFSNGDIYVDTNFGLFVADKINL
jgi:hypothetical protein